MVYYNLRARMDLDQIFVNLTYWKKHTLNLEEVLDYMDDLTGECMSLRTKVLHLKASYIIHKKYGDFVHTYRRNSRTCWYIIYTQDLFGDIFIERVMNNYMTIG
jgi:hypothetical protein